MGIATSTKFPKADQVGGCPPHIRERHDDCKAPHPPHRSSLRLLAQVDKISFYASWTDEPERPGASAPQLVSVCMHAATP